MELIGYLDSPFVRRVAITMRFLGIEYAHRELSIFRDFDQFSKINPTVKVPTLVLDDGQILIDSNLIISYLESHKASHSLMPSDANSYVTALHHIGIAMVAMEKAAQLIVYLHTDCVKLQSANFPALVRFSTRAEDLPEFLACPLA